jgi:predicted nucleotidyltransferase
MGTGMNTRMNTNRKRSPSSKSPSEAQAAASDPAAQPIGTSSPAVQLNPVHPIPSIPWLDPETAAAVVDIVQSLAEQHPEAQAVILFGSVARHDERPLDDPEPSDVDLLLLLDAAALDPGAERLTRERELALTATIGEADYRHRAPREIKFVFVYRDLARWDPLFIENVARDGVLLWARAPLPGPWTSIEEQAGTLMSPAS